jgi:flagellar transcriptional activator FlhD
MGSDPLLEDIQEINLSYLLLIQRLINTDREAAVFRLKIDEDMADLLGSLPVSEVASLARCNQLLCHFALQTADQLKSLVAAKGEGMRQIHAAILLSSNERKAFDKQARGDKHFKNADSSSIRIKSVFNGICHADLSEM